MFWTLNVWSATQHEGRDRTHEKHGGHRAKPHGNASRPRGGRIGANPRHECLGRLDAQRVAQGLFGFKKPRVVAHRSFSRSKARAK